MTDVIEGFANPDGSGDGNWSAAPALTAERLAKALRAMESLPVWIEIPDKDNPSVVTVRPDYKATAQAILASLSATTEGEAKP